MGPIPLVVVGTVAYDTIRTPMGEVREALGGSATYFSLAAALFTRVGLVAAVGEDFRDGDRQLLVERGVDVAGLQTYPGESFRWVGEYHGALDEAHTLETRLNVLTQFDPVLPPAYRAPEVLFLAAIDPELQLRVLDQLDRRPRLVACDTRDFWIEHTRPALLRVLERVDCVLINEGEARLLAGEHNVVKAAQVIRRWGSFDLIIKRGGYGALLFRDDSVFAIPAYPLEDVVDTTGAGDSFAGGFLGALLREPTRIRKALVLGNVVASFTVEDFSVRRLTALAWPEVWHRYLEFRDVVRLEDL